MRERGKDLGVADGDLDTFAREHADYVQVASSILPEDDGYWTTSISPSCGFSGKTAWLTCRDHFGPSDKPKVSRNFRVLEAYQNRLVIEPRNYGSEQEKQEELDLFRCCFGQTALKYNVRGGSHWILTTAGFLSHQVIASQGDFRCVHDCNPRRQYQNGRVFEVSTTAPCIGEECSVGNAGPGDVACVRPTAAGLSPNDPCVFQNLTHRFAVYRGTKPSDTDMVYGWSVTGGFVPLTANLTAQSRAVSPQSIVFVPQIGQLAVADGASEGLVMVSLDRVAVSRLFF